MRSDYFIALDADGTQFNPAVHRRRDIDPDDIRISGSETAGRMLITMVTDHGDPGLAKLRAGTTWAHISRELADGTLKHLAQGWIDPLVMQTQDEDLISMEVVCSPRDWDAAIATVLAPKKVLPGFDPVLVAAEQRNDAVEILDGYSLAVHCDPSTHAMTLVDILGVALPVIEIADPDWPGPQPDAATRPVARVDVSVTTEWIETRSGSIDAGSVIEGQFERDRANTLTPEAFESAFPKVDTNVGGDSGYVVRHSKLVRREDLDADIYPPLAGPARGSSGVYNYVLDQDLTAPEPQAVDLVRAWYDLELTLEWTVKQKRVQTARFSLVNGSPAAVGGKVEVLELKTEDITIDDTTVDWQPDTYYAAGAVRRVGSTNWKCTVAHQSLGNFGADLFYSLGGGQGYGQRWNREPTDASPLGSIAARTYFHTPRGRQTIEAAALKARAIIAASIRNRPYRFETELTDDLLDISTASVVRVATATGGWIVGKVTDFEIGSSVDDEYLSITISPGAGSGIAAPGDAALSQTGEAWDRIHLGSIADQQPIQLPAPGGTVSILNPTDEQLEYVQERDFDPSADRSDPKENDPLELLKAVPTSINLSLTQLSGRDELVQEIVVPISEPWSGPRQQE